MALEHLLEVTESSSNVKRWDVSVQTVIIALKAGIAKWKVLVYIIISARDKT